VRLPLRTFAGDADKQTPFSHLSKHIDGPEVGERDCRREPADEWAESDFPRWQV
jgi:hypothetical protein